MRQILLLGFFASLLFGLDGIYNIQTSSFDKDEVLQKVKLKAKQFNYAHLPDAKTANLHVQKIKQFNSDIENLLEYKNKGNLLFQKLNEKQKNLQYLQTKTKKSIQRKTRNYATLKRTTYYVVMEPIGQSYKEELQNFLIDKYAITKYRQNLKTTMSDRGVESFSYIIENEKEFGLMKQEVLKEHTYREKNLHLLLVKVVQYPFKSTNISAKNNTTSTTVDKFKESSVEIIPVQSIQDVAKKLALKLSDAATTKVAKEINKTIPLKKSKKRLYRANKQIKDATKKLYTTYKSNIEKLNSAASAVEFAKQNYQANQKAIEELKDKVIKLAGYYGIELNTDELQKIVVLSPAEYAEYVEADEEVDFVMRKTKKYLQSISLEGVAQQEKIINFYDLDVKNLAQVLMLQYDSLHLMPYIEGKKLSLMLFGVLKVEKKITKDDYIRKTLSYSTLEFLPVQKGYERIFVQTTELSVGTVKEFLEQKHKKTKYFFDTYCLEDSTLPEGARDFKNVEEEYYDYPAVCYKQEKIQDILEWLSQKVGKKITLATSDEWSYVATNANTTKYCWGNESVDELIENEKVVENIFIESEDYPQDGEPRLRKIQSFPPSKLGFYDMCGNGYELVKQDGEFMIKGNSYISYIEESAAPALEYDYTLNPLITLRVLYKQNR